MLWLCFVIACGDEKETNKGKNNTTGSGQTGSSGTGGNSTATGGGTGNPTNSNCPEAKNFLDMSKAVGAGS